MINKLIKSTVALSLVASVAFAAPAVRFNVVPGDIEDKFEELVLGGTLNEDTGFGVSDPHEKINDAYSKRYGNPEDPDYDKAWTTNLDNLGFFSIANDKALYDILKKAPQAAGFQPFNYHIYKYVAEDKTYVGHLDPALMLDVTGVKDKAVREAYIKMYEPLDKWTTDTFGGKVVISEYDTLPAKPMMTFEFEVDREGDIVEWAEGFQEEFEAAFEEKKYIIAGFKNFKSTYEEDLEMDFEEYDQFFVYGLCHFTYSYGIFNKGRPDAGALAPCAMYFYIKPGSNKMVVGMPRLETWLHVMKITDKDKIKSAMDLDVEIIGIMKDLGGVEK
ncbi:hypothetical protein GJV85_12995 [Sulfurimonas aquatica]|uniref:DUF302 domain-containing protein n=1 Tax=Sulfurimonas aquatica TaxID=2672570 RepID=A0A975B2K7_9BACT|nr:hypothetical protein [Sulfurimonas aquatica]QSZ42985.1 hypothetical protein GJV85_12995 [Sulfurimonas aquatica]